jgi:interferon gamma-inducible protein 30
MILHCISLALLLPFVATVPVTVWKSKDTAADVAVDVRVYFESLCPSSREFISQLSSQAPKLAPIISLSVFPYGNAHPTPGNETCTSCSTCNVWECNVTCQHGPQECKLNLAQACLLEYLPALTALPAMHCIERLIFPPQWCISHHAPDGVNLALQVGKCMRSPFGRAVQDKMATDTLQLLKPPKQFVPWVTVDGLPLVDDYKNLIPAVCQAYKYRGGKSFPEICANAPTVEKSWGTEPNISVEIKGFRNETIIYTRCRVLKVLGEVCVEVFVSSSTTTAQSLGIVLDFKRAGLTPSDANSSNTQIHSTLCMS